jgi:starvation-inducible DNA-binding protein
MRGKDPSHVPLPPETRAKLIDLCNGLLANCAELYLELKHAHWNVTGPQFYSLHVLFDDIAKRLRKHTDTIAERIAALGGQAQGTVAQIARNSRLPQARLESIAPEELLPALTRRLGDHSAAVRAGIEQADELDDTATEDVFIQHLRDVEQDLWFLDSSHRHAEPTQPARERGGGMMRHHANNGGGRPRETRG